MNIESSTVDFQYDKAERTSGDELTYFGRMIMAATVGLRGFAFHLSKDLADTGRISDVGNAQGIREGF